MRYNIIERLEKLGKHQADIMRALAAEGIKVAQSEFSRYVNGVENPPKSELVLSEADKIVSKWEQAK